jgi:hypothetical protein
MARVTIVTEDNIVVVDGVAMPVDCSPLKTSGLWAVQWDTDRGEEEFRTTLVDVPVLDPDTNEPTGETVKQQHRDPNRQIDDLSPYQPYLDAWNAARAKSLVQPFLDGMDMRPVTTATMLGVLKNVRQ